MFTYIFGLSSNTARRYLLLDYIISFDKLVGAVGSLSCNVTLFRLTVVSEPLPEFPHRYLDADKLIIKTFLSFTFAVSSYVVEVFKSLPSSSPTFTSAIPHYLTDGRLLLKFLSFYAFFKNVLILSISL